MVPVGAVAPSVTNNNTASPHSVRPDKGRAVWCRDGSEFQPTTCKKGPQHAGPFPTEEQHGRDSAASTATDLLARGKSPPPPDQENPKGSSGVSETFYLVLDGQFLTFEVVDDYVVG